MCYSLTTKVKHSGLHTHLDLLLTLQWLNYGSMQLSGERYSFCNERDLQSCSCTRVRVRAVRDSQTPTSAIPAGPHSDGSPRSSDRRAVHSSSITSWTMTEAPEPLRSSLSPIWRYFSSSLVRLFLSLSTHRLEENKKKHTIIRLVALTLTNALLLSKLCYRRTLRYVSFHGGVVPL